ncbi:hypothetical protein V6C53_00590 [Desulfocurvibacter africanus]|uniref:hypothetical protein n=1 Tax=Desulfocurvibacter africanus TaxID=873 RepID=UPI002FDB5796
MTTGLSIAVVNAGRSRLCTISPSVNLGRSWLASDEGFAEAREALKAFTVAVTRPSGGGTVAVTVGTTHIVKIVSKINRQMEYRLMFSSLAPVHGLGKQPGQSGQFKNWMLAELITSIMPARPFSISKAAQLASMLALCWHCVLALHASKN